MKSLKGFNEGIRQLPLLLLTFLNLALQVVEGGVAGTGELLPSIRDGAGGGNEGLGEGGLWIQWTLFHLQIDLNHTI